MAKSPVTSEREKNEGLQKSSIEGSASESHSMSWEEYERIEFDWMMKGLAKGRQLRAEEETKKKS